MAVIAIGLGGSKSPSALISPNGAILNRQKTDVTRKSGTEASKILQKQIQKLYAVAQKSDQEVTATGSHLRFFFASLIRMTHIITFYETCKFNKGHKYFSL